jgi:hypothetical protein
MKALNFEGFFYLRTFCEGSTESILSCGIIKINRRLGF